MELSSPEKDQTSTRVQFSQEIQNLIDIALEERICEVFEAAFANKAKSLQSKSVLLEQATEKPGSLKLTTCSSLSEKNRLSWC